VKVKARRYECRGRPQKYLQMTLSASSHRPPGSDS
jgi:hypothetical protein